MQKIDINLKPEFNIKEVLKHYAKMDEKEFSLAENMLTTKLFPKGKIQPLEDIGANNNLLYIKKGLFRVFYLDPKSMKERNTYFFQEQQFMVAFMIFDEAHPCHYFIEALEDCETDAISNEDLDKLYQISHQWEHFGRILAVDYYRAAYNRYESFIFNTPEERYLELIQKFPTIFQRTSLLHISSYLGVEKQSLSRIRNRIVKTKIRL